MHSHEAHLLALLGEVVDSLTDGLGNRTHSDDNAVGILSSVVVEETIFAASEVANLVHVVLYDGRNSGVVVVARLTMLEEHVGVLGSTAGNGLVGVHGTTAESSESLHVDKWLEVFLVKSLYLLDLVRSAETVEEVNERHAALDGAQVSNSSKVHNLLYRTLAQHGEAGLASCHYILVVTKDTQGVRSECASRNMENAWQQLTGNLVHVRDHQEQALRSGVGGGKSTRLERTVNGTRGTSLTLHFLHENSLAKDVFTTGSCPFVNVLCHSR